MNADWITGLTSISIAKAVCFCNSSFPFANDFQYFAFQRIYFGILMSLRLYLHYTNRMQENISFPAPYFFPFLVRTSGKLQSKIGRSELAGGHHSCCSQCGATLRAFVIRYTFSLPLSEKLLKATLKLSKEPCQWRYLLYLVLGNLIRQMETTVNQNQSFDSIYCRSRLLSKLWS